MDWSFNVSSALQLLVIIVTCAGAFVSIRSTVENLGRTVGGLERKVDGLNDVMVKIADMRGDLNVLSTRVTGVETDIRDLRHGRGFIRGGTGIDREYQ